MALLVVVSAGVVLKTANAKVGFSSLRSDNVGQGQVGHHARAPFPVLRFLGHRHGWEYAIVWLDKPNADNSTTLGVSVSAAAGWAKEAPPPEKYLDGNSLKVAYYYNHIYGNTAVKYTDETGEFQDLITWNQLSDLARSYLNNTDWDETPLNAALLKMPMKDDVFMKKLKSAHPF
ncbi:hypothetical protein L915_01800 [Phytophthora nicotianae]|uniref:Necrosis inducing protein NPP1 n=1 Tax=Phytophthora nicotianae TaxID=4792 RepID=W2HKX4_PHYNI|nr:hypothetical protein L915_01800 [Phytophthora nicotianae]